MTWLAVLGTCERTYWTWATCMVTYRHYPFPLIITFRLLPRSICIILCLFTCFLFLFLLSFPFFSSSFHLLSFLLCFLSILLSRLSSLVKKDVSSSLILTKGWPLSQYATKRWECFLSPVLNTPHWNWRPEAP